MITKLKPLGILLGALYFHDKYGALKTLYKFFHTLSLDVALGSVILALFVAELLDVPMDKTVAILLFLVVWALYLCDHYLDARFSNKSEQHPRLGIILNNLKIIQALMVIIGIGIIVLLFLSPAAILLPGFVLGIAVVFYFLLFHYFTWGEKLISLKEPLIALIYAFGVCLPAYANLPDFWEASGIILMIFSIALQNLLLFAVSEQDWDKLLEQSSLIGNLGRKNLVGGFYILNFISYPVFYFLTMDFGLTATIMFSGMNLWLAISMLVLMGDDNYWLSRMMGDATFILPALALLFL